MPGVFICANLIFIQGFSSGSRSGHRAGTVRAPSGHRTAHGRRTRFGHMFWLCRFRGSARLGLARSAVVVAVVDVVVDVVVVAVVGVAVAVAVVAAASWQALQNIGSQT